MRRAYTFSFKIAYHLCLLSVSQNSAIELKGRLRNKYWIFLLVSSTDRNILLSFQKIIFILSFVFTKQKLHSQVYTPETHMFTKRHKQRHSKQHFQEKKTYIAIISMCPLIEGQIVTCSVEYCKGQRKFRNIILSKNACCRKYNLSVVIP